MKKVLYTATVLSHICQFHLPYLKAFKENGYEVHVAAKDNLAEKNGLALNYADKFFEVPFSRSPKSLQNIKALKQLKKLLKEEYYDLIVCNTPMGGIITRMAAKKTRKKGTKVVYMAHGFHFYKGAPKKNWLVFYPIEKHFAKKCDVVITITDEDYRFASQKFKTKVVRMHGAGVDGERHIFVGIDEKLSIRDELGINREDFVCLCVGELNANKNQSQIVASVPKLKEKIEGFKLILAGNGKTKEDLERQIKELGVEKEVVLVGYQPKIERYVRACDVVLSASKREGLPFNVVEAMLAKKPVVVSENRGHRELVKDGETGFMTNDIKQFEDAIIKLYKDQELYLDIAEKAYSYAKAYTVQSTIEEFRSILE
ncbi:MAG: glycosyltransferase [Clostridia bacterium]|nr:glycosyltransferase [Clostridia bacterium]